DPDLPTERLGWLIADLSTPVVLVADRTAADNFGARLSANPTTQVVVIDEIAGPAAPAHAASENIESDICPDVLAYIIYTSGSTGTPKGCMNTHQGIVNRILWMQETYQLSPADGVLQKTPYSFDVSVWEFFWPLLTGARLVIAKPGGHRD